MPATARLIRICIHGMQYCPRSSWIERPFEATRKAEFGRLSTISCLQIYFGKRIDILVEFSYERPSIEIALAECKLR